MGKSTSRFVQFTYRSQNAMEMMPFSFLSHVDNRICFHRFLRKKIVKVEVILMHGSIFVIRVIEMAGRILSVIVFIVDLRKWFLILGDCNSTSNDQSNLCYRPPVLIEYFQFEGLFCFPWWSLEEFGMNQVSLKASHGGLVIWSTVTMYPGILIIIVRFCIS